MQSDLAIQNLWSRLLREARQAGETGVEKVEDGYYLVARRAGEIRDADAAGAPGDFSALGSRIPNLCRTRAVYLNVEGAYNLQDAPPDRSWLGGAARDVESGALRAFGVVDTEIFSRRIAWELLTRGWTMQEAGQDLVVIDGRFKSRLNLLRAIVRMVLSRASMAGAARSVVRELTLEFSRQAAFFVRFQKRFESFQPAVLDHYFVAYPDASCVALAWDYWQIAGLAADDAERVFQGGVNEFDQLLQLPVGSWLPGVSPEACGLDSYLN